MKPNNLGPFTWHEDEAKACIGEGVSRPVQGAKTKPFKLLVRMETGSPMRVELWAESKKRAVMYAKNRWPAAAVELLA